MNELWNAFLDGYKEAGNTERWALTVVGLVVAALGTFIAILMVVLIFTVLPFLKTIFGFLLLVVCITAPIAAVIALIAAGVKSELDWAVRKRQVPDDLW